jgi:hypothetical protein
MKSLQCGAPLAAALPVFAPVLETTKGNTTSGQGFIILSGVLIVAIANRSDVLGMEIAATANDAALRTLNFAVTI